MGAGVDEGQWAGGVKEIVVMDGSGMGMGMGVDGSGMGVDGMMDLQLTRSAEAGAGAGAVVQIYELEEHGRRLFRRLCYSSNDSLTLHQLSPSGTGTEIHTTAGAELPDSVTESRYE